MINTTTQVAPVVNTFYNRVLLSRALPYLAHALFGQQKPIPTKSGQQPKFRKYNSMTPATAPVVEGVRPSGQALSTTEVTGQMYTYGDYISISDDVDLTVEDPVLSEVAKLLGEWAGESLDEVYRDVLVAGSSVLRAGSVAGRSDITAKVSVADLRIIKRTLLGRNVKHWRKQPTYGSTKVASLPIAPSFYCITHPMVINDLEQLTGWVPIQNYPDGGASAMYGEVGALPAVDMRFISSTKAKYWADSGGTAVTNTLSYTTANTACDVYSILIFGQDAYGITPLQGHALKNIIHAFGHGDDPLEQECTSAWKAKTGCLILDDLNMYRYECGVSA